MNNPTLKRQLRSHFVVVKITNGLASFKQPNGRERRHIMCIDEMAGFKPMTLRYQTGLIDQYAARCLRVALYDCDQTLALGSLDAALSSAISLFRFAASAALKSLMICSLNLVLLVRLKPWIRGSDATRRWMLGIIRLLMTIYVLITPPPPFRACWYQSSESAFLVSLRPATRRCSYPPRTSRWSSPRYPLEAGWTLAPSSAWWSSPAGSDPGARAVETPCPKGSETEGNFDRKTLI